VHAKSLQLYLTLCDPADCSLPGSSVHGILQARTLEWVAISFSRGSFWPRDRTHVSYVSCTDRWALYHCATWKAILYWGIAAVHGVAKSRTRLSDFIFTFHFNALEKEMATHYKHTPRHLFLGNLWVLTPPITSYHWQWCFFLFLFDFQQHQTLLFKVFLDFTWPLTPCSPPASSLTFPMVFPRISYLLLTLIAFWAL